MALTILRLRRITSAWASWLPRWPTCMCAIMREEGAKPPAGGPFQKKQLDFRACYQNPESTNGISGSR